MMTPYMPDKHPSNSMVVPPTPAKFHHTIHPPLEGALSSLLHPKSQEFDPKLDRLLIQYPHP